MTHPLKIVAIGSPFGDDQLGWEIAHRLTSHIPDAYPIVTLDRPGMTLISHFSDASVVLIIDAIQSDAPPGTIHWLSGEDIPKVHQQPSSSHDIGVKEIYQLSKTLSLLPNQLDVCGIECDQNWQESSTISPIVAESVPTLLKQIIRFAEAIPKAAI